MTHLLRRLKAALRLCGVLLAVTMACAHAAEPDPFMTLVQLVNEGRADELRDSLAKAPPGLVNLTGRQMLTMLSIGKGRPEVVEVLLDWGIDPNRSVALAAYGYTAHLTPLMYAAAVKAGTPVMEALLRHGADPNLFSDGTTALNSALSMQHYDAAAFLLDHGADARLDDADGGSTPLMAWALGVEKEDAQAQRMLQRLLTAGVDVNARDRRGATALLLAVARGKRVLVQALLDAGADPRLRNDKGESPADLARRRHRDDIAALLDNFHATP